MVTDGSSNTRARTATDDCSVATVIAVGPGKLLKTGARLPMSVKVGDHVLFGKWNGTEVKLNGEELLIVKEEDLFGVVENDAAASTGKKSSKQ